MIGATLKDEALRRMLYKELPNEKRKGNELWSWVHKKWQEENPGQEYNEGMITYMAEGKLRPVFVKNFPADIVEKRTQEWVEPTSLVSGKYNEYQEMLKDAVKDWENRRPTLDSIRSWAMRWYWKRDGQLPHATSYKRNAGSVFLHLIELKEEKEPQAYSFECSLQEIKNLWY